ncbi:hypothetical protein ACIREO_23425 [Streptomyces sp. NPDC102441]|uniref:hypothetical protein n=1 Tax=Streptomyces sp. NPDC102441 TaxID=3366176 RepID=UPI003826609D
MRAPSLSNTAIAHLRKASTRPDGHLPTNVSRKLLRLFLEKKYAYRDDGDGFVREGEDALKDLTASGTPSQPSIITLAGRRAALTEGQNAALSRGVESDGRLARTVPWPTAHALARLLLVEFRDERGKPCPGHGLPYRTELGKDVTETAIA